MSIDVLLGADLARKQGRPPPSGDSARSARRIHQGIGDGMHARGKKVSGLRLFCGEIEPTSHDRFDKTLIVVMVEAGGKLTQQVRRYGDLPKEQLASI